VLLYGKKKPEIKDPITKEGREIQNAVLNIVYERFLRFLESESRKERNTIHRKKEYQEASLLSHLSRNGLKRVFNYLLEKKMIRKMVFADFLNCLNGKQIIPRNRIYWVTSKSKGYYLFSKICPNFSMKTLNASVAVPKGRFDSNNKPSHGYKEIDNLLQGLI
jgi:hypothetical protein